MEITFTVPAEDEKVVDAWAERQGISVQEFLTRAFTKEIDRQRVDLAFKLLEEGKVGLKRAWVIARLSYTEFSLEWHKRNSKTTQELVPAADFDTQKDIFFEF